MGIRQFHVQMESVSALLMHFDNIEAADEDSQVGKRGGKPGDDRHPADRWMRSLYIDPTTRKLCIPSDNIEAMLKKAGSQISLGRMKTLKTLAESAMFVEDACCPLEPSVSADAIEKINGTFAEHAAAVKKLGFELFVKRVKVGGKRHIRVRPRFATWRASCTITVTEDSISEQMIGQLWEVAGRYVGLCDWRPKYGRFTAQVSKA